MPRCRRCDHEHEAADLVRHERESFVRVHCPDCTHPMGEYHTHAR